VSRFQHALCAECWTVYAPARIPVTVRATDGGMPQTCCECQRQTVSGIYVREEPGRFECKGVHPIERHP
jgi:hypothetical protein